MHCGATPVEGWSCGPRIEGSRPSHTTHFIFAIITALGTADAETGRCLGADGVDALEAGDVRVILLGAKVFVLDDDAARATNEGVADGHGWRGIDGKRGEVSLIENADVMID